MMNSMEEALGKMCPIGMPRICITIELGMGMPEKPQCDDKGSSICEKGHRYADGGSLKDMMDSIGGAGEKCRKDATEAPEKPFDKKEEDEEER